MKKVTYRVGSLSYSGVFDIPFTAERVIIFMGCTNSDKNSITVGGDDHATLR